MEEILEKIKVRYQNRYISLSELEYYKQAVSKKKLQKKLDKMRELHNQKYLEREEQITKDLLDNVKGYSLDKEQREVVLREEQNTLVIAGAGSGKSLTMIGKIRYLVERKKVPFNQILCISFTNDATNSLKKALKKNYNYDLPVLTFHKLALQIIQQNGGKVHIANDKTLENTVENYLKKTIFEEKEVQKWICQHFFHNLKKKTNINVNKLQSFPQEYEKIQKTKLFKQYYKIIPTFIHLMKANQYKLEEMDQWIQKSKKFNLIKTADTYLLYVLKRIYEIYKQVLKEQNALDFDDLIAYATELVKQNNALNYRYILIDEYQDTSKTRYQLIQEIIKKTNAKLIAVGDDFQSIYRFTGCNLNIFLKFKTYFSYSIILKIQTTYRNSQELINIAGSFVMKNPRQMSKNLVSSKRFQTPVIIQYYQDLLSSLKQILDSFQDQSVFLLGRNRKDIFPIIQDIDFQTEDYRTIVYKSRKNLLLTFLTVHTSKGLECDVVIVLNMANATMGFPNQLEEDSILQYVNATKDYFPYEEERRLFYVAMTRTKNQVYLMTPQKNPSVFIKELEKENKKHVKVSKIN